MTHLIDHLGSVIISRGPKSLRFFADGWGEPGYLGDLSLRIEPAQPAIIDWVHHRSDGEFSVSVGVFESPAADILPARSRLAAVSRVAPVTPTGRTVVLMAAWN